jgi:hypothetical protein
MAWIESHDNIADHPKTRKVARDMKMSVVEVVGALHCLWHWCLRYAEDGDLSRFEPRLIADASRLHSRRSAEHYIESLIEAGGPGKPGFLERTKDGRLLVHDWWDFAGKLIEKRKADRERKRKSIPLEFQRSSIGSRSESRVTKPTVPTLPSDGTETEKENRPKDNISPPSVAAENSPTDAVTDKRLDLVQFKTSIKILESCGLNGTVSESIALNHSFRQVVSACHASFEKRNRAG